MPGLRQPEAGETVLLIHRRKRGVEQPKRGGSAAVRALRPSRRILPLRTVIPRVLPRLLFLPLALCFPLSGAKEATAPRSATLLDEKLLRLVEKERNLFQRWEKSQKGKKSESELEFHFRNLVQDYEALTAANPKSPEARILYGKLLRKLDQPEQAFRQFLEADKINPGLAAVKQQLGNHLAETGDYKGALKHFQRAIGLAPEEGIYHYSLAELLFHYRKEFAADGVLDPPALNRRMLQAFAEAARLRPDNLDLQFRYGEAFYDMEKPEWEKALAHWTKLAARELPKASAAAAKLHQAKVLFRLGRIKEARDAADAVTLPALQEARRQLLDKLKKPDPDSQP